MASDLKDTSAAPAKPKRKWPDILNSTACANLPLACCVCTEQKAKRDECMLFSSSDDAQKECAPLVDQYKQCMAGYGFKI
jgi:cytochrome c oxidase assembly protein subunit 17